MKKTFIKIREFIFGDLDTKHLNIFQKVSHTINEITKLITPLNISAFVKYIRNVWKDGFLNIPEKIGKIILATINWLLPFAFLFNKKGFKRLAWKFKTIWSGRHVDETIEYSKRKETSK